MSRYGRYQAPEPPSNLASLHIHDGTTPLREVDHEPKMAVLDQEDLLAQGIYVDTFIPGAQRVDALGSCTANATTVALSNVLTSAEFAVYVAQLGRVLTDGDVYADTVGAERAAIGFYHATTDLTGDPGQEWPPTDCGSSGPYIVNELQRLKLIGGQRIAHGAQNIISLLQTGCVLLGSPFFFLWEEPDAAGFVDGKGTAADLQAAIQSGVAGGHETTIAAVEKLALTAAGQVIPQSTVLRVRNSWGPSFGDAGSFRIHLSTLVSLGGQCDFRAIFA
jgi:hypothetical protein